MILREQREALVRYSKGFRADGLALLTAGNMSARVEELVAITPTSIAYDELTPELVCVVDLDGAAVDAARHPSSELPMHLAIYAAEPVGAIVHTHSPYATALSTVVDAMPPIHYLIAELGGTVRVAPYAPFGTQELADNVRDALAGRSAALLANHGAVAVGATVEQAYERSLLLEWLCALFFRARMLGEPRLLPQSEVAEVAARLARCRDGAAAI